MTPFADGLGGLSDPKRQLGRERIGEGGLADARLPDERERRAAKARAERVDPLPRVRRDLEDLNVHSTVALEDVAAGIERIAGGIDLVDADGHRDAASLCGDEVAVDEAWAKRRVHGGYDKHNAVEVRDEHAFDGGLHRVGPRERGAPLEHLNDDDVVVGFGESDLVADRESGSLNLRDSARHAGVEELLLAANAAAAGPDLDDHRAPCGGVLRIAQHRGRHAELVVPEGRRRVVAASSSGTRAPCAVLVAHCERPLVDGRALLLGEGLKEVARALFLGCVHARERCIEAAARQAQSPCPRDGAGASGWQRSAEPVCYLEIRLRLGHNRFGVQMTTRLFIGGLSWGTTDESLAAAFAVHGTVVDARVIYDRETGRSRGFGFVTFADPEEAALAVRAMNGADLDGRAIRVDPAEERPNPRRRTRDEDGLSASRS